MIKSCVRLLINRILLLNGLFKAILIPRNSPVIILAEHLGDIIAATPLAKTLFENHKLKPIWIVNNSYREVLARNPYVKICSVRNLGEAQLILTILSILRGDRLIYNCHFNNRICLHTGIKIKNQNTYITPNNYYDIGSLLDVFASISGVKVIDKAPDIFNSKDYLNENRIVIHAKSNEEIRNCNDIFWEELVAYLLKNTTTEIYLIGQYTNLEITHKRFINFSGIRNLDIIIQIIQSCNLFIGVDSGFAHIANSVKKNSIIILNRKYKGFLKYEPFEGYFKEQSIDHLFRCEKTEDIQFIDFLDCLNVKLKNTIWEGTN